MKDECCPECGEPLFAIVPRQTTWRAIEVGIVRNVRQWSLYRSAISEMYLCLISPSERGRTKSRPTPDSGKYGGGWGFPGGTDPRVERR